MDKKEQEPDQLIPIRIASDEITTWRSAREDRFRWVQRLVRYLPRRKGWVPRRLGRTVFRNTKGLIRVWNSVVFAVVPDCMDFYIALCNVPGCVVTEMCQRVLTPGNCFFDIGANIGSVSLSLAKYFKDQIYVHAFEPQATLARYISISAALNGFQNVSVYQILVGEADGEADLFVTDDLTCASLKLQAKYSKIIRCPIMSLDHQI